MHHNEQYLAQSLELHLFFARIMKEHSLFLIAGFTPVNADFSEAAKGFLHDFEKLLCQAVSLSDGLVSRNVLASGELVTEFTPLAEQQTECFTGIHIDKGITAKERLLHHCTCAKITPELCRQIHAMNQRALELLNGLISLKEKILSNVLSCRMFTMNYPLLLEHVIREAKLYREYVCILERNGCLDSKSMRQVETFWNQIMMEHALFIRGLLDPTENDLIQTADSFAQDYAKLLECSKSAQDRMITENTLAETKKFRDFKAAGTKGIEECNIRSVILPLLADHVLREANHYIRLLSV